MKVGADGLDVGLVCTGWSPQRGGVQSHTEDLASELVRRGHRVAVLCLDTSGGDSLEIADERVALPGTDGDVAVRRVRYAYGDHAQLMDLMVHERLRDVVLGWLAETPSDVVHVHHVTGFGGTALRAISDVGQPLVMTLHDYWMLDPRGQLFDPRRGAIDAADLDGLTDDLVRTWPHLFAGEPAADREQVAAFRAESLECLDLCDLVFTPSSAARDVFVAAGVDGERLRVVENGIAAERIAEAADAARVERGPRTDGPARLGVLGSILPSKGVAELAETLCAANARGELVPSGVVLDVFGDATAFHGWNEHVERLERCASEHPDLVHVHAPFERAELGRVLAGLDGVAVPSRWVEVFGLGAREARAAGLPVLVADRGGLPEAVAEDRGGRVVPDDGWSEALVAFADPERRAAWAAAESRVHDVAAMTEALLVHYADAIEARTGERPVHAEALRAAGADDADGGNDSGPKDVGAPAATAPRRGLFARLFGRRD